ncbi:branched-chain amino acid ABC transporter permease [Candidatus Deferrimicrobium sp.]|uniref:branched-chain amino acid ABC transporter permease n=1 Tax=Candidatus Deferrimicrobium sp. TaxID=3060586 RepID=UPI002ED2648C
MASPLPQVLLDGFFAGGTYALMAAGMALILGVVKVINLSHGAFFTLGAYVAYALAERGIGSPLAAAPLAAVIAFAFGVFLGKSFVNPARAHPFALPVGTLACALLFEQAAQMVWGPHPLSIEAGEPWIGPGGLIIRQWGVIAFLSSAALLGGLKWVLSSRPGLPLRLIAEDEEIAGSLGMDVEAIRYLTFGGACAMAAAAGALLSPSGAVTPTMGRAPLLLSLVVVIVAGMDSVAAIFLLSIGLGIFGNACAWLLSPQWSYVALLAVVCLLLSARPAGIVVLAGRRD